MNQLVLPLRLADHAVFASFYARGNDAVVDALQALAEGSSSHGCWLWGPRAAGKTHLLQAVCERAGDRAVFVPLALLAAAGPAVLDGLESRDLVCIDDIDKALGDDHWETALFGLCNRLADSGGQLVIAADAAPRESGIRLADLASRLARLPVFHMHALDEEQRIAALRLRAQHRGLELPADSARYLIKRSRRDMASLYELLDKLDLEALRAQRKLTIPFVRDVLQL